MFYELFVDGIYRATIAKKRENIKVYLIVNGLTYLFAVRTDGYKIQCFLKNGRLYTTEV